MEEGLVKVTPDKEKAKSIVKMVETTLALIKTIDASKFASNVVKEYYEVVRELSSVVLLLDGFKTQGEGAHKRLIEYLDRNYKQFYEHEITLLEELRITRNKIAYDGFFVTPDYLGRNQKSIADPTSKLRELVNRKLQNS